MIAQQVNLYHPIFRKQQKRFSAKAMLQAGLGVLLGIALLYGYAWWQLLAVRGQVALAGQEYEHARTRLATFAAQVPGRQVDPRLEQQARELTAKVAAAETVRQLLTTQGLHGTSDYSKYFAALARQHIDGVWLTEFSVSGPGDHITLNGRTVDPELVAQYLQRLAREPAFAGAKFQVFQLHRPDVDKAGKSSAASYVEFTVKTTGDTVLERTVQQQ